MQKNLTCIRWKKFVALAIVVALLSSLTSLVYTQVSAESSVSEASTSLSENTPSELPSEMTANSTLPESTEAIAPTADAPVSPATISPWDVNVTTDPAAGPYKSGDVIAYTVTFSRDMQLQTSVDPSESFTFQLYKDFAAVASPFIFEKFQNTGKSIFIADNGVDNGDYKKYTLTFNPTLTADELDTLTSVGIKFYITINSSVTTETTYVPVIIEKETETVFNESIVVEPTAPTSFQVNKKITSVWTDASQSQQILPLPNLLEQGNLVQFTITVTNPSTTALTLDRIVEALPEGYEAVSSLNPAWVASGSEWVQTFSPQLVVPASSSVAYVFYAKVKDYSNNVPWADAQLWNKATAYDSSNNGASGYIGGTVNAIDDIALYTGFTSLTRAGVTKTFPVSGGVPDAQIKAITGDGLVAQIALRNQGTTNLCDIEVVAYVPRGYAVNDPNWEFVEAIPDQGHDWSELSLYRYKGDIGKLLPSETKMVDLKLTVLDHVALGLTDLDYYYGAEVSAFNRCLASGSIPGNDVDSTPDSDPYNDLTGQDGGYYEVNSGSKEKDNVLTQNAKGNVPNLADEDDFDFGRVNVSDISFDDNHVALFQKYRVGTASNEDAIWPLANYINNNSPQDWFNAMSPTDVVRSQYAPVGSDGTISVGSKQPYIMYRFSINQSGTQDINGVTITDTLPDGLTFLKVFGNPVDNNSGSSNRYGYFVSSFLANPLIPTTNYPQGQISSDASFWIRNEDRVRGTSYDGLHPDPWYAAYNSCNKSNSDGTSSIKNLRLNFSADGKTVTITADRILHAEVNIILAVGVDPNATIDYSDVVKNQATLTCDKATVVSTESDELHWDIFSSSSYALKMVKDSSSGEYVDYRKLNILDSITNPTLEYRIRVLSKGSVAQNTIHIIDQIKKAGLTVTSVSDPMVTAYSGSGISSTEFALLNPQPQGLQGEITASYDDATGRLTIDNPLALSQYYCYDIDFSVSYDQVKPGQYIENIALTKARSIRPLVIILEKTSLSGTALEGAEFTAYYTDGTGKADLSRPLLDVVGNPVKVYPETNQNQFSFVPENYLSGTSAWEIALVETQTPSGYETNLNNEYVMTVNRQSDGSLVVGLKSSNLPLKEQATIVTSDTGSVIRIPNGNGPAPVTARLVKENSQGVLLSGAVFEICMLDSSGTRVESTSREVTTNIQGEITFDLSEAGTYTLVETGFPLGYETSTVAKAEFIVQYNSITSLYELSLVMDGSKTVNIALNQVAGEFVFTALNDIVVTPTPTESTTTPTEITTTPTESTTTPTESRIIPTESTMIPTESTTAPTENTVTPTESTTVPTTGLTGTTTEDGNVLGANRQLTKTGEAENSYVIFLGMAALLLGVAATLGFYWRKKMKDI